MSWKEIPIEYLIEADWNYKKNKKSLQDKLTNNIERNGFIENLIVRELGLNKYEVVNGNHRLKSLRKLNYKNVMCYNLGLVGLGKAKRIALETNETKFGTDRYKLSEIIKEISNTFDSEDLKLTLPFDEDELLELRTFSDISDDIDLDFSEEDFDLDDVEVESKTSVSSVSSQEKLELMVDESCHSKFQRFYKKFKKINEISDTADDSFVFSKINEKLKKLLPT